MRHRKLFSNFFYLLSYPFYLKLVYRKQSHEKRQWNLQFNCRPKGAFDRYSCLFIPTFERNILLRTLVLCAASQRHVMLTLAVFYGFIQSPPRKWWNGSFKLVATHFFHISDLLVILPFDAM